MPYQNIEDGLYLVVQRSHEKGVDHYGILDIGNRLNIKEAESVDHPIVIHQTPPTIQLSWLQNTGSWLLHGRIMDENMAIMRINHAVKNPSYNLFENNCEHFARYVATGVRESRQIQSAVVATGLVTLTLLALRK